jgi:hypothetical protein
MAQSLKKLLKIRHFLTKLQSFTPTGWTFCPEERMSCVRSSNKNTKLLNILNSNSTVL